MNERVKVLRLHQVFDPAKGGFFVGLTAASPPEYHKGMPVHVDKFGARIVIARG